MKILQFTGMKFLFLMFGALAGLTLGLGIFTFHYAKGASYLTDNPQACVNCHIMREYYDSWQTSSHRQAASCNGCHTPHDVIGKYTTKAVHGIRHSWGFTTGLFPDPIVIKPDSLRVVEENCRSCHAELFDDTDRLARHSSEGSCISCHRQVAHMR